MEPIRPTGAELDAAYRADPLPVSEDMRHRLIPSDTCQVCGCPIYTPGRLWQSLSPVWCMSCDHAPGAPKVNWYDLTPEQQGDLVRISATAAIRVKGWSQPKG